MPRWTRAGNVNVSRFGDRIIGIGGFVNISQNAKKVIFSGTFTAGGLAVDWPDGQTRIQREGREKKFVAAVQQLSYSGAYAAERGQDVLFVTERAVFRGSPDGLVLIEVAPRHRPGAGRACPYGFPPDPGGADHPHGRKAVPSRTDRKWRLFSQHAPPSRVAPASPSCREDGHKNQAAAAADRQADQLANRGGQSPENAGQHAGRKSSRPPRWSLRPRASPALE